MRDYQRGRLYAAENVLHWFYDTAGQTGNPMVTINGVTVTLPPEAKFASVDSIQAYIDRVLRMPGIRKAFGPVSPPRVCPRRGATKAHYCAGSIFIPIGMDGKWAQRELVILHELAHHIAAGDGHGPRFADTFLTLLGMVLGPEVELIGRMTFADNAVKAAPKSGAEKEKEIAS